MLCLLGQICLEDHKSWFSDSEANQSKKVDIQKSTDQIPPRLCPLQHRESPPSNSWDPCGHRNKDTQDLCKERKGNSSPPGPRMPTRAGHQLTTAAHPEFQAILLELTLSESFFHRVGTWGFSAMTHILRHTDKPGRETDLPGRGEQADADISTPQLSIGLGWLH